MSDAEDNTAGQQWPDRRVEILSLHFGGSLFSVVKPATNGLLTIPSGTIPSGMFPELSSYVNAYESEYS